MYKVKGRVFFTLISKIAALNDAACCRDPAGTGCTHISNTHAREIVGKFVRQALDSKGISLWKCDDDGIRRPGIQTVRAGVVWKIGRAPGAEIQRGCRQGMRVTMPR
jgi:hypothetical protein